MTLPTLNFSPGTPNGTWDIWGGGGISAPTMVDDFVDLIKVFFPATVHFDYYEVFTKATATADSILRESQTLAQVGTSSSGGWSKAAEAVWTFKTTLNGLWKLVLLDNDTGDNWDKLTFATLPAPAVALANYMNSSTHGWSGRDDGHPVTFLQVSFGLNKALRRKYNMN